MVSFGCEEKVYLGVRLAFQWRTDAGTASICPTRGWAATAIEGDWNELGELERATPPADPPTGPLFLQPSSVNGKKTREGGGAHPCPRERATARSAQNAKL
jgi:hypothetical protein